MIRERDLIHVQIAAQSLANSCVAAYHDPRPIHQEQARRSMEELAALFGCDLTPVDATTQAVRDVMEEGA